MDLLTFLLGPQVLFGAAAAAPLVLPAEKYFATEFDP